MSKRATLFTRKGAAPEALPEPVTVPAKTTQHRVASTRIGKRNLTAYVDEETFRQFKVLAAKEDTTIQDLLVEGVNAVFERRRITRSA
ncbi:ribbon-helix-helix domain-containing protein [Methylobacterium sp. 285MFTsu5.1]|uniref:ribbon-helix-helix domain-containing protein n=1 Tax=Methylobacterium sp. 285MFTsu5.1 TaxID=1172187 RepID=UPI00131A3EB7|nr:ribbon-helix-helix domain-containing protein [Methylobacterium sp. 285MFTsu5.1]